MKLFFMKYIFRFPIITLSLLLFSASQCKRSPTLPEFYYRCIVDGQDYRPNGCANCLTCTILRDTVLLLGANKGYESVNIGINDFDSINIKNYSLNNIIGRQGGYDNSPLVDDKYITDELHTGVLSIIHLDKNSQTIEGSFSFQAYNPIQNKTVSVTEGKFRLKYTIN